MTRTTGAVRRRATVVLSILLVAFLFRVGAQALQAWRPVRGLPGFGGWDSATVPYAALLLGQAVVVLVCLRVIWRIAAGTTRPRPRLGRLLLVFGVIYFGGMAVRLILGFTLLSHVNWFDAPLPSLFHLVLAGFVIELARFHLSSPSAGDA